MPQPIIDPREAELIRAHVLKKPREWVAAHPEYEVPSYKVHKVIKLLKRREQGVPLAYLTSKKEFFGLEFFVDKNVLIPRPETETMVSLALDQLRTTRLPARQGLRTIVIDVGTGSGCIPIAIANQIRKSELSVTSKFYATDISSKALAVARKNAKRHKVKIKFLHGDLLFSLLKNFKISKFQNFKIFITANLPYLTPQQFSSEPSIRHEPRLALLAGKDGLKYYRELLKQIRSLITNYQLLITVFLEINPSQSSAIKLLIKKHLPRAKVKIHKDLAGRKRVAEIT